jgi:hypothetical protein
MLNIDSPELTIFKLVLYALTIISQGPVPYDSYNHPELSISMSSNFFRFHLSVSSFSIHFSELGLLYIT